MHHNTNYLTPTEQNAADVRTEKQSSRVLACLRTFGDAGATPEQIHERMGGYDFILLTSVRRSLSDMTLDKDVEKIADKVPTKNGGVCSRWRAL